MNHSKAFYNAVSSVMPDYKECEKWIKEKGKFIISAMP
jgi:predicted metal-dependent hydrolase